MASDNVLMSIEGISVNRGLNRVLDKFDFKLFQGEIVALNGENGCAVRVAQPALNGEIGRAVPVAQPSRL